MDEYQIVERVKDWYREGELAWYYLLPNGNRISSIPSPSYHQSNKQAQISERIIGLVYLIGIDDDSITTFEFPMLDNIMDIVDLYIYKRGFVLPDEPYGPYPLPNLKYFICGARHKNRLAVELIDLDVVGNNLNLFKIMSSVLGAKLLSDEIIEDDDLDEIRRQVLSQKLFAGHTLNTAELILSRYFFGNIRKLSKEVFKISQAYVRVFRPYRIVYDTKTWELVLM